MSDSWDEKTLDPTPQRRQRARAEGRVARSGDLNSAGLFLGSLLVLVFTGGALLEYFCHLLTDSLGGRSWMWMIRSSEPIEAQWVAHQWHPLMSGLAKVLLPTLGMVALAAIALNVVQTGVLFLPHKVAPDLSRLNPLNGWRRIFSADNTVRLSLGVLKLALLATVAFASIYQRRAELVTIGSYDLPRVVELVWQLCLATCLKVGSALLILALADYGFERWRHERELKMSPQELREELRNMQADPQIAARRRVALREKGLGNPPPAKRQAA